MKHRGLRKRGNVWWLRYSDNSGRVREESSHSANFKDARALLDQRRGEVREGKEPPAKIVDITFAEFAPRYLDAMKHQKSPKQSRTSGLVSVFGNLKLRQITALAVENWRNDLLQDHQPATANRYLALLKHALHKACQWGMCPEDTWRRVAQVQMIPERNMRTRYLTPDECRTLIGNCSPRIRPVVVLALFSGMRYGEIINLTWDRVDLVAGLIRLDDTKSGHSRVVRMNLGIYETLDSMPRDPSCPFVFQQHGNQIRDIRGAFETALSASGIHDFRIHDLRHTAASLMVQNGVDLAVIREVLGHRAIQTTMRYSHMSKGPVQNAVDVLDKVVRGEVKWTKSGQSAAEIPASV